MTVSYRVITGSTGTSTGNRDIVLGGWAETPVAAIVIVTEATAFNSEVIDSVMAIGFTDGTTTNSVGYSNEDGQANTDCARFVDINTFNKLLNNGTTAFTNVGTITLISGGIRINWSVNSGSDYKLIVIAIAGDVTAVVGQAGLGASPLNVTHASGVASEAVFMAAGNGATGTSAKMSLGFWAADSNTNRCFNIQERDNQSVGTAFNTLWTDSIADGQFWNLANYRRFACSQWVDGFTLTTIAGTTSAGFGNYLSLNYTDSGASEGTDVGTITTPTSTGDASVTGLGFRPGLVLIGSTFLSSVDAQAADSSASCAGIGAFADNAEASACTNSEDGAATTGTNSHINTEAMDLLADPGLSPRQITAAFTSMDADGFTLNYNPVDATGRKWFYIALGGGGAPPEPFPVAAVFKPKRRQVHRNLFKPKRAYLPIFTPQDYDICTSGNWSSTINFAACDTLSLELDGPATNDIKASVTLELEET